MKKTVKSVASILSRCLAFSLCAVVAGCKTPCASHDWNLTSTTATCKEGGTETYCCATCGETKTESVAAYGHNYNKNVCERCKTKLTDLSQFPENYRNEIADSLLLIAPYIVDSETFITSTRLLKLYRDDVNDCENKVSKAQQALDNAKNEATVRRYVEDVGWVWQADEKKIAAAEKDLTSATNSLKLAQDDLEICKVSYTFNCEGYAWNIAILGIRANDVSNYAVNYNLAELMAIEMTAVDSSDFPSWYLDIIQNIRSLTGLDIRENKSQFAPNLLSEKIVK